MANESPSQVHKDIVRDAGIGSISLISVFAGVVTAYGTSAIVAAIVGASLSGTGVDTEFRTNDWTGSGAVALLAGAVTLLVAYLFGGYVAGRMARRSAVLHGIAVFVLSLVAGAVVGTVVGLVGDNQELKSSLRNIGVPTSADQVTGVAIVGVAVSLGAVLLGSVLGALLGERWHTKLARRIVDPAYGPEAEARARAEREEQERQERVERERDEAQARIDQAEQDRRRRSERDAVVATEVGARRDDDRTAPVDRPDRPDVTDGGLGRRDAHGDGDGDPGEADIADRTDGSTSGFPAGTDHASLSAEERRRLETQEPPSAGPPSR